MQLNFLGKALFAATGALIVTKVIERLNEEETLTPQPARPYNGYELLAMLDRMSLGYFKMAAGNGNWVQFNKMVDASPVRPASYQQRCAMWEICRQ